jgi:sec-independent protein translocase protein TatA
MQFAGIGTPELMWVALAAVILFGGPRLPQLFRGLGEGLKEFKKATRELTEDEAAVPARRDDSATSA